MSTDTLINSIATEAPGIAASVVAEAVAEQYGLRGELTLLVSERDQNFRLLATTGKRYVVKIVGLAEDPVVTDFQIAALVHLESLGIQSVPSVVRTKTGDDRGTILCPDGTVAVLRVVTWLDGTLLDDVEVTPSIAGRFGLRLAELDTALKDFTHDGDEQLLLWDVQRAAHLRELLVHVEDAAMRQQLASVLDDFENRTKPALDALPRQVIHNDANTENVLLNEDSDVCGIIDFGDMLRAPRIIEISTAAAYLQGEDDEPLRYIAPLVAGYHSSSPLEARELDVLYDLIRTRLVMSLAILYWRLAARHEDDPYSQKSLRGAGETLHFLQSLNNLGRAAFGTQLRAAVDV